MKILLLVPPDVIEKAFLIDCLKAFQSYKDDCKLCFMDNKDGQDFINEQLQMIADFKPDFLFTINTLGYSPKHYHLFDTLHFVSWFYDNPQAIFRMKKFEQLMGPQYHAFVWDRSYMQGLGEMGVTHCEYLPLASNPQVFKPIDLSSEDHQQFSADISFVGASLEPRGMKYTNLNHDVTYRRDIISELGKTFRIKVYGDHGWQKIAGGNIEYMGYANNREDMPKIYKASKITLNLTATQIRTGYPSRVYDCMASEALLISDKRDDAYSLFKPGKDIVLFKDIAELKQKVQHYIDKPQEAHSIAREARQTILNRHTFEHRIGQIREHMHTKIGLKHPQFQRQVRTNPNYFYEQKSLSLAFLKLGKYNESLYQAQRALKLTTSPQELGNMHIILGDCHKALNNQEQALVSYQCALKSEPRLAPLVQTRIGE